MSKAVTKVIGILALSACLGSTAFAGSWTARATSGFAIRPHTLQGTPPQSVPEIDPASALSGLTLLLGGLAMVRGRRKSR